LLKLVEQGWGREDVSYRQMFAMQFAPGATLEQINSLSEMQRRSSTLAKSSPSSASRTVLGPSFSREAGFGRRAS
jgi:hypothetical protein